MNLTGETVIENNCDLVGAFGILVQVILVLLIFTAVKRRLGVTSEAPFRATAKDPQTVFHGRIQAAVVEQHAAHHERVAVGGRGQLEATRSVRHLLHVARDRRHARPRYHLRSRGAIEQGALGGFHEGMQTSRSA